MTRKVKHKCPECGSGTATRVVDGETWRLTCSGCGVECVLPIHEGRAYAYGAWAPANPAHAREVDRQMFAGHRYQNALVSLERDRRRARLDAAMALDEPFYRAAGALALSPAETDADSPATKAAREELREAVRVARSAAFKRADVQEACAAIEARVSEWGRLLRANASCDWGTYLLAEAAALAAKRSGEEPRFQKWRGDGAVAVQLIGGISVEELLNGNTRVRLAMDFARPCAYGRPTATLHLRVGTVPGTRTPVWITAPVAYHRPLPAGVRVMWVRLQRRRVGTGYEWRAIFTLRGMKGWSRVSEASRGTVAVDVGWRKMANGDLRVAVWRDSDGRVGSLRLPARMMSGFAKVHELQSVRENAFNATLADVRAAGLPVPRSTEHLAAFAEQNRGRPEPIYARLETWRKQDKHLLNWQANQSRNVLHQRREKYRLFAAEVTGLYRKVVVERLNLSELASPDPEEHAAVNSNRRRFKACLHELLGCIADRAKRTAGCEFIETVAAWTTQTCPRCLEREPFDAARELEHTCSHCGAAWDQDVAAAETLLRAVQSGRHPDDRSPGEVAENRTENPGRRAGGKAKSPETHRRSHSTT